MNVKLKIQRFDPESDAHPYIQEYSMQASENDRILDLLIYIKRFLDGSLAFRKSCAHGVCGSDAMIINGLERLACKTLVKDVIEDEGVTIQPLQNLPVQRDLMVDQAEFFSRYRSVKPFLINNEPPPERERIQSPDERRKFDDATKCILCSACFSACPVIRGKNPLFLGPAQVVQASRFINDSRDKGFEARLEVLDSPNGVWPCENHFKCTQACPRSIKVTKLINLTKKKIKDIRNKGETVAGEA